MDYEKALNELKVYIRERLYFLTEIKESNTFYGPPFAPEYDDAIEMMEKSSAFIEDAERNRESSGMNYEELWTSLWDFLLQDCTANLLISLSSVTDDEDRLHANGKKSMATTILNQMATIRYEMATAGEDDGQSAQD